MKVRLKGDADNSTRWPATTVLVTHWILTRVLALSLIAVPAEHRTLTDLGLYHDVSVGAWRHGLLPGRDFSWEYPPGALLLVLMPLPFNDLGTYAMAFVTACLALDALVFGSLLRGREAGESPWGTWIWLATLPALGPTSYLRIDLASVALCVLGLRAIRRRPAWGGLLLAVGAGVKFWPAGPWAVALVKERNRLRIIRGTILGAVAVLAFACITGTLHGFQSALSAQSSRSVQVEALPALPFMWLNALGGDVQLEFAHLATQLHSHAALVWSLAWMILTGLGLAAWVLRRGRDLSTVRLATLVVALLLLSDKVLSPQYLLWLFGLVALSAAEGLARSRQLLCICVITAGLTQLVFPLAYGGLLAGRVAPLLLLTVRDLGLVAITALCLSDAQVRTPADRLGSHV